MVFLVTEQVRFPSTLALPKVLFQVSRRPPALPVTEAPLAFSFFPAEERVEN